MLSGVGPKATLDEHKIPQVVDLPVGQNLQVGPNQRVPSQQAREGLIHAPVYPLIYTGPPLLPTGVPKCHLEAQHSKATTKEDCRSAAGIGGAASCLVCCGSYCIARVCVCRVCPHNPALLACGAAVCPIRLWCRSLKPAARNRLLPVLLAQARRRCGARCARHADPLRPQPRRPSLLDRGRCPRRGHLVIALSHLLCGWGGWPTEQLAWRLSLGGRQHSYLWRLLPARAPSASLQVCTNCESPCIEPRVLAHSWNGMHRGEITLTSADPLDYPDIDFRFLSVRRDWWNRTE